MRELKSNPIALTLVWLAFFAFVAHTFDFGCSHCVCLHHCVGVPACEIESTGEKFAAPGVEIQHCCEGECKLFFDSPEPIEIFVLLFSLFVLGKALFSNLRNRLVSSRSFRVPLGRNVFLFFESLLI